MFLAGVSTISTIAAKWSSQEQKKVNIELVLTALLREQQPHAYSSFATAACHGANMTPSELMKKLAQLHPTPRVARLLSTEEINQLRTQQSSDLLQYSEGIARIIATVLEAEVHLIHVCHDAAVTYMMFPAFVEPFVVETSHSRGSKQLNDKAARTIYLPPADSVLPSTAQSPRVVVITKLDDSFHLCAGLEEAQAVNRPLLEHTLRSLGLNLTEVDLTKKATRTPKPRDAASKGGSASGVAGASLDGKAISSNLLLGPMHM